MRVKVRYLGLVREKIGEQEGEFEIEDRSSLADLLDLVAKTYGLDFKDLVDPDRTVALDPSFLVTINGVLVNRLDWMKTTLKNGDEVALMTLIAGG